MPGGSIFVFFRPLGYPSRSGLPRKQLAGLAAFAPPVLAVGGRIGTITTPKLERSGPHG